MQLVIALLFVFLVGCTEVVTAHIRIVTYDNSKIDYSLRVELAKLGWNKDEESSGSAIGKTFFRHTSLPGYFIRIDRAEGKGVKITFVGVARKYFSPNAVSAYRSLVVRLQADFGNAVEYDVQTSSGQWIGDSSMTSMN